MNMKPVTATQDEFKVTSLEEDSDVYFQPVAHAEDEQLYPSYMSRDWLESLYKRNVVSSIKKIEEQPNYPESTSTNEEFVKFTPEALAN